MDTLELVLRQSNGAILIPLKKAAGMLGREPQTWRNQISKHKCVVSPVRLEPIYKGRGVFFHAIDLATGIDKVDALPECPRRGRPSKAEKMRRESAA